MKNLVIALALSTICTAPIFAADYRPDQLAQATTDSEAARRADVAERMERARALRNNGTIGGMQEAAAIERQLDREAGIVQEPRKSVITNCTPNGAGGMNCVSR
jgi:hypothetical protein